MGRQIRRSNHTPLWVRINANCTPMKQFIDMYCATNAAVCSSKSFWEGPLGSKMGILVFVPGWNSC